MSKIISYIAILDVHCSMHARDHFIVVESDDQIVSRTIIGHQSALLPTETHRIRIFERTTDNHVATDRLLDDFEVEAFPF